MDFKACNGDCYCPHRLPGGLFFECKYEGYCDFQAPRDSRNDVEFNDNEPKQKFPCDECSRSAECEKIPQGAKPPCIEE